LETYQNTTSAQGSCQTTASGLVPKPVASYSQTGSRLPTSGPDRLYKPDTVTQHTGKVAQDFLDTAWNRFFVADSRPPPLVHPDLCPIMGNGVSSQGNVRAHDQRDIRPSVAQEQHDWQTEQAVAPKPETLSLQQETQKSYSNFGPILHRFRELQVFLLMTPPYSTLILGVFPLHQIAHVRVSPSTNLMLISREIIFKVFQPK